MLATTRPAKPGATVHDLTCLEICAGPGGQSLGLEQAGYRQIGNAFPPPAARAVGDCIRVAIEAARVVPAPQPAAVAASASAAAPVPGSGRLLRAV